MQNAWTLCLVKCPLYSQVIECVKKLQDEDANDDEDGFHDNDPVIEGEALDSLMCWTSVQRQSHDSPGLVLDVLLRCKRFDTANQWASLHHMTDKLRLVRMTSI